MLRRTPAIAALGVLALSLPSALAWWQFDQAEEEPVLTQTRYVADSLAMRLSDHLGFRFALIDQMRRESQAGALAEEPEFRLRTTQIMQDFPGFQALNRVDAQGIIRWVVPLEGNEAALGRDVHTHAQAGPIFERAEAERQPQLTPPLVLFQGGVGYATYYPIVQDDQVTGYLNGVFRSAPLIGEAVLSSVRSEMDVQVRDGDTVLFSSGEPIEAGRPGIQVRPVTVHGRHWDVRVAPKASVLAAAHRQVDEVIAVLGLLMALTIVGLLLRAAVRQRALDRSESARRGLMAAIPDHFVMLDDEGCVLAYHGPTDGSPLPALADAVGRPLSGAIGEQVRDAIDRASGGGPEEALGVRVEVAGRCYEATVVRAESSDRLAILRDVTEREGAEAQIAALELQVRQHHRLQAIGTLASGVAHEVNNPVQAIVAYADLAGDLAAEGSELHDFMGQIRTAAFHVTGIVKKLLAFARLEKVEYRRVDVAGAARDAIDLIGSVLRRDDIHIELEFADDLPAVLGQRQQLQQVVMNLITNARDALNERFEGASADKRITLSARQLVAEEGLVWLKLTVEDRGGGIPPELMERVMDPFFTTKDVGEGTGLGLSVSHGIVTEHGGRLEIESEPGEFTRVHVYLPAAEAEVDAETETEAEAESTNVRAAS